MSGSQQAISVVAQTGGTAYHDFRTISASSRERVVVGTVGEGAAFRATALAVSTVQDPGGDLDVALFNGQEQVTPESDPATMATDDIGLPSDSLYDVGDEITVELDARDRNSSIDVTVIVGGVRTDSGVPGAE